MRKRILAPLVLLLLPLMVVANENKAAVDQTVVAENVAVEAKAVEAKALEAKAVEVKALEAKAVEAKAVEAKAVEAKAVVVATAAVETVAAVEEASAPAAAAVEPKAADQDEGLNPELAPIYKMPAWVERVETFCPWKSSDAEGYVRVVRTERHGRHQLFLQWIRKGGTTSTDTVLSTRSIEELEKDYIVRLEMPTALLNPKSCELTTIADSLNNSQRFRFKVLLRGPGNYQLTVTQVLGTAEF